MGEMVFGIFWCEYSQVTRALSINKFILKSAITLQNILDEFLYMEESEKLFTLQSNDGVYYWDIVRVNVYIKLHSIYGGPFNAPLPLPLPSFLLYFKDNVKKIINWFTCQYIVRRRPKYIFITCQRIRQGSNFIDEISDHLYDMLFDDSIAIELSNKSSISYFDMLYGRRSRVPPVSIPICKVEPDLFAIASTISEIVSRYFDVTIDAYSLIAEEMTKFRVQRGYYLKLFSQHCPKSIVCVNNGDLKGIYSAANEMKIPVLELQHGEISTFSMRAKYPLSIKASDPGLALPSAFLTFSDYWNDIVNFPVKRVFSIGNDYLRQNHVDGDSDGVLFISAYMYHDALLNLALELAKIAGEKKIYYKLHPHQFNKKAIIVDDCRGIGNIVVVSDEMDLQELFMHCTFVVGVHSTMIYTALQAGKNVCLYKYANYFYHKDIFPYVQLFDSAFALKNFFDGRQENSFKNLSDLPVFFKPFDSLLFKQALNDISVDE